MQEQPTVLPAMKKPRPWLLRRELLTNQVADCEILLKVLIPFELNSPWAKNSISVVSGISAVVACVQAAPFEGASAHTRIRIRVIGVAVGAGVAVVELLPQLGSSVVMRIVTMT
jgi:hypothetical protein